jgi:hypothetical protein
MLADVAEGYQSLQVAFSHTTAQRNVAMGQNQTFRHILTQQLEASIFAVS